MRHVISRALVFSTLIVGLFANAPVAAFLPSLTTPTARQTIDRSPAAKPVSPELAAMVLADPVLGRGVERIVATPDGKRLAGIIGRLSAPVRGNPEEIARAFVTRHAGLFNLPTSRVQGRLETVRTVSEANGAHVFFRFLSQGTPVLGANLAVHMNRQGEVILANGSVPMLTPVRNHPSLDGPAAVALSRKRIGERESRGDASARLVLSCHPDGSRYAWEVSLPAAEPLGDWVLLLDATTGDELDRRNDLFFFSGTGLAYANHPLLGQPVRVELPYLSRNDLAGDYCYALNGKGPAATSSTNVYDFTPDDTHFDEVNAFYHVNRAHDFFARFGFKKLDFPIWTTVHFRVNFDNAFYSGKEKKMYFGDGEFFNDFAKEEAIIYHEYSHGVLNEIVAINYYGESGAIHEGQADYFACTLSENPVIGEWISSKTQVTAVRYLQNTLHYPENIEGEVHADGRIWGGALWDLRLALGAEVTDRLIFASFYNLKPETPTFIDGANAILAADTSLYDGKHKEAITSVFAKRGILGGSSVASILDGRDLERARAFGSLHGE